MVILRFFFLEVSLKPFGGEPPRKSLKPKALALRLSEISSLLSPKWIFLIVPSGFLAPNLKFKIKSHNFQKKRPFANPSLYY